MVLVVALMASCTKSEITEAGLPAEAGKQVVSATIDGAASRVLMEEIDDPAGNYVKVDWKRTGESFMVFASGGTAIFEQTASTDDSPSQFEGNLPQSNGSYWAIYPADLLSNDEDVDAIGARFVNQQGVLDESLCVMSANSDGSSFHFQHGTSILRPTFKVDDETLANQKITRVEMASQTISFINDLFGMEDKTFHVKVQCDQLEAIYLYVVAQIEAEDEDRSFDVVVETDDAKIYTGVLTVPDGKSLLPGKFYTPTITLTQQTEQVYNSETQPTPDDEIIGDGSTENPYKIFCASDLAWLLMQAGTASNGKYYEIESDFVIDTDANNPWSFCDAQNPFQGQLDGQGHTISGTLVADPYAFLFGFIGFNQGVVKDLIMDAQVTGSGMLVDIGPMFTGDPNVHLYLNALGAVVGANNGGQIDGCSNTGTVVGGSMDADCSAPIVSIGGLVGINITGKITNSSNSGNVTGASSSSSMLENFNGVGGITGGATGSLIDNCSNSGVITGGETVDGESIAGGVVGYSTNLMGDVIISNCTNSGAVNGSTADGTDNAHAGGIVGFMTDTQPVEGNDGASAIQNCTNNAPVTGGQGHEHGDTFTGGIVGSCHMADITGCTNSATAVVIAGDAEEEGNLQGGWVYAGGIAGYFASHGDEDQTSQITTTISKCKNYAAIQGPLSGDWAFIGGIVGQATSGHMVITQTENHGAVAGRGSENVNSLYVGGVTGRNVGDCTEIFKCVNYGTIHGGTADGTLYTGGITGDHSGRCSYAGSENYVSRIYDTVNEANGVVTQGVSLTATPDKQKAFYGGIAGSVSKYNDAYYQTYPYVCTCCVDKSNCAGGLIGSGNTTTEPYDQCTSEHHSTEN